MSKPPAKPKMKASTKKPAKRAQKPTPPPPIEYSLRVTAPVRVPGQDGLIYPGDPVTITGTSSNLNPKLDTRYDWTSDGGLIEGSSNVASIDTKGMAPGIYIVKGHVSQGPMPGMMADDSVSFRITEFEKPTPAKLSWWKLAYIWICAHVAPDFDDPV